LTFVKSVDDVSGDFSPDPDQPSTKPMSSERVLRFALVVIAIGGLGAGLAALVLGRPGVAGLCFMFATVPVIAGLAVSMVRDLMAGRLGVDAIALVSMSAAIALGQPLAGAVVALMYSGGNVLEDIAVARAEHDLPALVDRAPRQAHRRRDDHIESVERHSLAAMSRAHREILHLARLLARIAEDLPEETIDRYLIRDAQRVIEAIETLVCTAQQDDIYEAVTPRAA
jgi:hypothetical protein